jgi:YidC/Oxa1 family membrane protein insertase
MILAVAICFGLTIAWTAFFAKPPPKQPAAGQAGAAAQKAPAAVTPPVATPLAAGAVGAAPLPDAAEETAALGGKGFQVTLSSWGGALKSVTLEGKKFRRENAGKEEPLDLVRLTEGQPYPLALVASPEVGGPVDPMAAARAPMRLASHDATSVVFEGKAGKLDVRKTYRLSEKPYELALSVEVTGGADAAPGSVILLWPSFQPQHASAGFLGIGGQTLDLVRPVCRAVTATERIDPTSTKEPVRVPGDVLWVGSDQHYFVAAALPAQPVGACVLTYGPVKGAALASLVVPTASAKKLDLALYLGPKDLDNLQAYGRGFDTAIEYSGPVKFFAVFARALVYVMRWLERLTGNWGIAIILLTLLAKVVLFPLTYKQMQSMNAMRALQPEIEKLKALHGDDREAMGKAQMALYQKHKVNPLAGCLPMLLQMPIWFALYAALQTSVELYREPFLWIHDLTLKDPLYALPLAMGASSFIMQKLSPQPADNSQAKMMLYFMPIFFTGIMLSVPAGLTLYIFVNNVLSIAQQQLMMRQQPTPAPAAAK